MFWKKFFSKIHFEANFFLSDSDTETGGISDLLGSEKVREC